MAGAPLEVTTELQREQLHTARNRGGQCAACGRQIGEGETVYIEQFTISGRRPSIVRAPVGVECASPELLRQTAGQDPERCAGCGRPVYYRTRRANRRRALCSMACRQKAYRERGGAG